MPRIQRLDTPIIDIVIKLADGNPGAATVMMQILAEDGKIDPDNVLGSWGTLLSLDTHGIYGPDIWRLFTDVCGSSIEKMLAALRAVQLGLTTEGHLLAAIDGTGRFDTEWALQAVKEQLPAFGRRAAAE